MLFTFCFDIIFQVFFITGDDAIAQLYIDGIEVTNLPNRKIYYYSDTVSLPPRAQVIAISVDNSAWIGGILGSSKTFITDETWKVTTNYTDGWMAVNFNDSIWVNATPYTPNNGSAPYNYRVPPISAETQWIATDDVYQNVVERFYFRYRIQCSKFRTGCCILLGLLVDEIVTLILERLS